MKAFPENLYPLSFHFETRKKHFVSHQEYELKQGASGLKRTTNTFESTLFNWGLYQVKISSQRKGTLVHNPNWSTAILFWNLKKNKNKSIRVRYSQSINTRTNNWVEDVVLNPLNVFRCRFVRDEDELAKLA